MKKTAFLKALVLLAVLAGAAAMSAQQLSFDPYDIVGKTAASDTNAFSGFANPAASGLLNREYYNFTTFLATPAFSFESINLLGFSVTGLGSSTTVWFNPNAENTELYYRLNSASSYSWLSMGFGYEAMYDFGNKAFGNHVLLAGISARPFQYLSLGTYGSYNFADAWQVTVDGGVRPFGTNLLTVFGKYAFGQGAGVDYSSWSVGASVRPVGGLEFFGSYASGNSVSLGLTLRSRQTSVSGSLTMPAAFDAVSNYTIAYAVENSPKNDTIGFEKNTAWVEINLKGSLTASSYFGKTYAPVLQVLGAIYNMKSNAKVGGILLNLSGFSASRSVMYEIRKALADFKKSGKKIIAFIDNAGTDTYSLACVADAIVMDPFAQISLEGYYMGRLYLKNALEKLGIGVTEIKLFTHKTAAEEFSRSSMSDQDKEQYLAYIDTMYRELVTAISEGRGLSEQKIGEFLEKDYIFTASKAVSKNLVDYVGRLPAIRESMRAMKLGYSYFEVYGDTATSLTQSVTSFDGAYYGTTEFSDDWETPKTIAVVYLDGGTDLDSGMNARLSAKLILEASQHADAIVLRVNSPGGDAVAADYIAEAVLEAKRMGIPVIVSMSDVAASGGYWVSMNADQIFATPYTLAGSIGVIYSWLYDNGLNDKLGLNMDGVQKGSHADAYAGLFIPHRNLTDDEIALARDAIKEMYAEFVRKVAEGRDMTVEAVEKIAQGRWYSGIDAQSLGLVDSIGTLYDAIEYAKEQIGLAEGTYTYVDEYFPDVPYMFLPSGFASQAARLVMGWLVPQRYSALDAFAALNTMAEAKISSNGEVRAELSVEEWELLYANSYSVK